MILQNTADEHSDDEVRFVIKNVEHAALAAELARNFGNSEFAAPEPNDEMLYLVAHHDHGWLTLDEKPPVNEEDGFPYNLVNTPLDYILETSRASPDFNERHSPFCGLISSMHTCGLYNGRYGLSDAINLDWIPEDKRADVDKMLVYETERQARLKAKLADSHLNSDNVIFRAYKFLQFVDACALYFNMNPEGKRGMARFRNVPKSNDEDINVDVVELENGCYLFKPYPFTQEQLKLHFEGRYLKAGELKRHNSMAMAETGITRQQLCIVAKRDISQ